MVAELFLATAEAVAPLLRSPELMAHWTQPSALADFRTSGLAGHTARAVLNVERYLDAEVPPDAPRLDAVEYFLAASLADAADPASTMNRAIRERGEQEAAGGPQALADAYDAARTRLASRLAGLRGEHPVLMFGRYVLPLNECLLTRLVELVVHADDLPSPYGCPLRTSATRWRIWSSRHSPGSLADGTARSPCCAHWPVANAPRQRSPRSEPRMALDSPGHGTPYLHTLDGRVDHREGIADDETHAYFTHLSAEPLRNGAVAVHYRCAR